MLSPEFLKGGFVGNQYAVPGIPLMLLPVALAACHPSQTVVQGNHDIADDEPCSLLSEMGISDPSSQAQISYTSDEGGKFFAVISQFGPLFFGINDYSNPDLTDEEESILLQRPINWVPEVDYFCEGSEAAIESFQIFNIELMRLHLDSQ
jgi:hypothetical protein